MMRMTMKRRSLSSSSRWGRGGSCLLGAQVRMCVCTCVCVCVCVTHSLSLSLSHTHTHAHTHEDSGPNATGLNEEMEGTRTGGINISLIMDGREGRCTEKLNVDDQFAACSSKNDFVACVYQSLCLSLCLFFF